MGPAPGQAGAGQTPPVLAPAVPAVLAAVLLAAIRRGEAALAEKASEQALIAAVAQVAVQARGPVPAERVSAAVAQVAVQARGPVVAAAAAGAVEAAAVRVRGAALAEMASVQVLTAAVAQVAVRAREAVPAVRASAAVAAAAVQGHGPVLAEAAAGAVEAVLVAARAPETVPARAVRHAGTSRVVRQSPPADQACRDRLLLKEARPVGVPDLAQRMPGSAEAAARELAARAGTDGSGIAAGVRRLAPEGQVRRAAELAAGGRAVMAG